MPGIERLVRAVERGHRRILAGAVCLLALSALSLLRLEIDMDLLAQLPDGTRTFRDYHELIEHFAARDTLIVRVHGDARRLADFGEAFASRVRELPGVVSARYRIDARRIREEVLRPYRWQLLTGEDYDELERRLSPEAIRERVHGLRRAIAMPLAAGAAGEIRRDPLGVDEILGRSLERRYADPLFRPDDELFRSPSGRSLLVLVRPERSAFDTVFGRKLLDAVAGVKRELLEGPFAGSGLEVGFTGPVVFALADRAVLERDLGLYFVVVPAVVLMIFHLGLRTLRILPIVVAPLVLASLVTFALSLLLYGRLTMVSVAFAGIFYGLGVDSSIYFYATLRTRLGREREELREAIIGTLREIGPANLLASATTAASFFVIGFSDFVGVSQLGILTGIAMLLNVGGIFVLLPAMIFHQGARGVPAPAPTRARLPALYDRIATAVVTRPGRLAAAVALAVAVSAVGASGVGLDTHFMNLRPGGGEPERVERAVREEFGGGESRLGLVTYGKTLNEALERTARLSSGLRAAKEEGLVRSWSSVTALLPPQSLARERLERFRSLPRERVARDLRTALAAEGFDPDRFEAFFDSWLDADPPLLDPRIPALDPLREQHVHEVDGPTRVVTWVRAAEEAPQTVVAGRLRDLLDGEDLAIGGQELVETAFRDLLGRELVGFFAGALALNLLLMVVFERGLANALLLLAPTLLGLLATFGIMGLAGIAIDPVNVIVLPVVLGLGVDGAVYLAAHLREARSRGEGAGRGLGPLLLATGTTIAGFGSLAFSRFPALGTLGLLAALGIALSAVASLLLVPVLARERPPR